MKKNESLLLEYQNLLQTTNIQICYQHVLELLHNIHDRLQVYLSDYIFMKRIVENEMNFSYFQLSTSILKQAGLKLQVIFIHNTCTFEIWLSGYNRNIQKQYYSLIKTNKNCFTLCDDPMKNDYILKATLDSNLVDESMDTIISEMVSIIQAMNQFCSDSLHLS